MSLDPPSGFAPSDLPQHSIASYARVVAAAADAVRQQVSVVASAAGVQWEGPASRRFRAALDDRGRHVGACAASLDDLAAALSAHAAAAARAAAALP